MDKDINIKNLRLPYVEKNCEFMHKKRIELSKR